MLNDCFTTIKTHCTSLGIPIMAKEWTALEVDETRRVSEMLKCQLLGIWITAKRGRHYNTKQKDNVDGPKVDLDLNYIPS